MSSSFRIIQHRVPCQYIREYGRATSNSQEDTLYLAVKQYVPLSNPKPQPGDVTIIAATANGFPKELYEPLWDDLLAHANKQGWRIRSIWAADAAWQGESYVVNEKLLGNEPHWNDHARDLLHLINLKREEMPRPIIGVGHSMGGAQIVNLALIHPRLLTTVVLLDPVIQPRSAEVDPGHQGPPNLAQLSTFRRTLWPSREVAAASFKKSPFYQTWDSRVLERWAEYGIREGPTVLHPNAKPPQVTLTTPPAQEVFTFLRPNYEGYGVNGKPVNRRTHADIDPSRNLIYPFYRSEAPDTFRRLPELRPSALYLFGEISNVGLPEMNREKLKTTGTGVGGSGGAIDGRVKGVTFEGVGHLIPMEAVEKTADAIAKWVGTEMMGFREEQKEWEEKWKPRSLEEKQGIDDMWRKMIGGPPKRAKM